MKQDYACAQITYTLEGRADGIFTDTDGMPTIDEIKTTTLPPELITGEQSPEHWHRRRSMRPSTRGRTACPLCGCG